MNVRQFLSSIFSNRGQLNGELTQARDTGRHHAEVLVGAYLDGFEDQAAKMLLERRQRLIGFSDHPEEIEGEASPDYSTYSRPELMKAARERGIKYERSATSEDLIGLLS